MTREDVVGLRSELLRVRALRSREAPYGPAWAALAEWVDEIEAQLLERTSPRSRRRRAPSRTL